MSETLKIHKEEIETKEGFKKTKIGWIPEDWKFARFRDVSEIDKNSLKSDTDANYEFRYISLSDVNEGRLNKNLTTVEFKNAPSRARRIVKEGSILMATVRPNLKSFCVIDNNPEDLIASTGFAVIDIKGNIDSEYLFQFLFTESLQRQVYALVVGSNYPAINSSDVKNLKIPLPPFSEQQKIASILSDWDETIGNVQILIETLELRKKGLMQQLLTSKKRLPGFSEEWKKYSFNELLREVKRPVNWDDNELYKLISVRRRSGGLFHRESLLGKEIKTKNLKTARTGDFLISKMQIVHGASGLVTEEYDKMKISGSYIALRAKSEKELNMEFFNYLSKQSYFYYQTYISSYGVHIEKMTFNFKSFLKLNTKIPSTDEQKAIVEILDTADQEIKKQQNYLGQLQAQKKGLMQQLLTGEIRVKV